jgi:diaminopimelate decarboxylase
MTAERDKDLDSDATQKMPRVVELEVDDSLEDVDPEATLARDDWESTVIRRVAPHVAAVHSEMAEDSAGESRYGWESDGLRRLAHEVQKVGL